MSSQSSHDSLQKRQEAAAEVAATQEVIQIMKTQHQYEEEIRKLEAEDERLTAEREVQEREIEAENARKRAQFISEGTIRKIRLKEKKKEVERLEALKRHNASQARLHVYADTSNLMREKCVLFLLFNTNKKTISLKQAFLSLSPKFLSTKSTFLFSSKVSTHSSSCISVRCISYFQ